MTEISAFAMEHPFITFFMFCAVMSTVRVVIRGWPTGEPKTDDDGWNHRHR